MFQKQIIIDAPQIEIEKLPSKITSDSEDSTIRVVTKSNSFGARGVDENQINLRFKMMNKFRQKSNLEIDVTPRSEGLLNRKYSFNDEEKDSDRLNFLKQQ